MAALVLVDETMAAGPQGEADPNLGRHLLALVGLIDSELTDSQRAETFQAFMSDSLARISPRCFGDSNKSAIGPKSAVVRRSRS
jgi:hypothetical protein